MALGKRRHSDCSNRRLPTVPGQRKIARNSNPLRIISRRYFDFETTRTLCRGDDLVCACCVQVEHELPVASVRVRGVAPFSACPSRYHCLSSCGSAAPFMLIVLVVHLMCNHRVDDITMPKACRGTTRFPPEQAPRADWWCKLDWVQDLEIVCCVSMPMHCHSTQWQGVTRVHRLDLSV